MASQGNKSKQVQSVVVRVKKPEVKEKLVENHFMKITIISVSACGVLVVLLITSFIVISIKIRKRKGNGYDIKYIDCESDQKINPGSVEDKEREEGKHNDPKERFQDVFSDDVHNKSVSSSECTKFTDNIDDDMSESDPNDDYVSD